MTTIKDHALSWVRKRYPVVPIRAWGNEARLWKQPLIKNWTEQPLRTELEVNEFWTRNPDANLALVTGQASGIIVLDFDNKLEEGKNGLDALRDWERNTGKKLPEDTWTSLSGGGGSHWYYSYDKPLSGFSCGELAVDVRADGNCILLPPSKHFCGKRYQWEYSPREFGLLPADENVLGFIQYLRAVNQGNCGENRKEPHKSMYLPLPDEIRKGDRESSFKALIGAMTYWNLSNDVMQQVVRMENEKRVFPPMTEEELTKEVFPMIGRWKKGSERRNDYWNRKFNSQFRGLPQDW